MGGDNGGIASSKSLVACPSVGPSIIFVKSDLEEYQMVTKTFLPSYLWDISDSSDQKTFLTKRKLSPKLNHQTTFLFTKENFHKKTVFIKKYFPKFFHPTKKQKKTKKKCHQQKLHKFFFTKNFLHKKNCFHSNNFFFTIFLTKTP